MPQIGSLAVPWSPFVGAGPSRTAVLVCIVLLPSAPGELVEVEQLADNGVLASLLDALHDAALQVVLEDQRLQLLDGGAPLDGGGAAQPPRLRGGAPGRAVGGLVHLAPLAMGLRFLEPMARGSR